MKRCLLLLLICTPALADGPRILSVAPLLAGHFRPEQRYPLVVRVHGGQTGFDGILELRWERATLARTLKLGAGAASDTWFYPVARRASLTARLALKRAGATLASRTWKRHARKLYPIDRLVGVYGPAPGQMDYFGKVRSPDADANLAILALRRLPDRAAGLSPFDLLIFGDGTRAATPGRAGQRALADWFALGGGLIVCGLPTGRLPLLRPLLGQAPLDPGAWNAEPTTPWAERWLAEFGHGRGRGLLCRADLFHDDLPGEGSARLWDLIGRRLLAPRRRPANPGSFDGAERFFGTAGHLPEVARRTHRFIWGVLGLLLIGATLLLCFSPRPRRSCVGLTLALSVGASLYLDTRRIPAGQIARQSICLLELSAGQPLGRLQRWTRLTALRPVSGTLTLDCTASPRLLGAPQWQLLEDGARTPQLTVSLATGAYRDLAETTTSKAVTLALTEPSGLPANLLNTSTSATLRGVAVLEQDRVRLLGDLEPGDALLLGPEQGRDITLEALADRLLPGRPRPLQTLKFLLRARHGTSQRVILARTDLAARPPSDRQLLPAGPTPCLILLPWE